MSPKLIQLSRLLVPQDLKTGSGSLSDVFDISLQRPIPRYDQAHVKFLGLSSYFENAFFGR
jgi:hypothetical protein